MMISAQFLEELANRLASLVPGNMQAAKEDLSKTFKASLQAGLSQLNLVTREEFDVQQKVLQYSREKIQILEQQVELLNASLKDILGDKS